MTWIKPHVHLRDAVWHISSVEVVIFIAVVTAAIALTLARYHDAPPDPCRKRRGIGPGRPRLARRAKKCLGASRQTATCERLRYVRKASIAWAMRMLTLSIVRHAIAA